jgi:hypothetical protein
MRLNDEEIIPMGEHLVTLFENEEKACHLLYAVSGAGKTRAIFDMAMHNKIFVTYIECIPAAGESKVFEKMEPTADTNFGKLVEKIKECFATLAIELARIEAKRLIALEFTARVLYLVILKKRVESLTPREYLLTQINGGQESIAMIKPYLKSFETSDLETIFMHALRYLKVNNLFGN